MRLDQVRGVLNQRVLHNQEGAQCDGTQLLRSVSCNDMISTNSLEAQIIADAIEDRWSERQAVVIVNKCLLSLDQPFISRNQLHLVAQRIKYAVLAAQKSQTRLIRP